MEIPHLHWKAKKSDSWSRACLLNSHKSVPKLQSELDWVTYMSCFAFHYSYIKISTTLKFHFNEIKRRLLLGRKVTTNLDSILKSRDITLPTKVHQSNVWMWELDYKESWAPKNWCFWTVVLEKTIESPFSCKEIQPIHPKWNKSWLFIGRTDAEAPILLPPDVKNWFIGKDPDAGKDWRWEQKGTTEDEMVGWHHRLNGHEFE